MSDYLEYLSESTNVVKSRRKLSRLLLVLAYLVVWALALIVFWFFTDPGDAMGYSVMYLWILLPVTTFVLSLLIGKNNFWGKGKWFSPVIFGVMYMLAEYATFGTANVRKYYIIEPSWGMIAVGGVISLTGLVIGMLAGRKKKKHLDV